MVKQALGLIETVGLAAAIAAADAAVKAANVQLLGYELARGGGLTTIKFFGDVGAVTAAVAAGKVAASKVNAVWSSHVIPRPHSELSGLLFTKETVGLAKKEVLPAPAEKVEESPLEAGPESSIDQGQEANEVQEPDDVTPEVEQSADTPSEKAVEELCNLCSDPACARHKGEPRVNCIHYEEHKNREES